MLALPTSQAMCIYRPGARNITETLSPITYRGAYTYNGPGPDEIVTTLDDAIDRIEAVRNPAQHLCPYHATLRRMLDLIDTAPGPYQYRGWLESKLRYSFDSTLLPRDGWSQIDTNQDAEYYGTWTNPHTLHIVSFCEGDVSIDRFGSIAEYASALAGYKSWPAFIWIDAYRNEEPFRRLGLGYLLA